MVNDSSGRIVADLRALIAAAPAGARLPSTRDLVTTHQASPLTVQHALGTLAAEGLIDRRPGAGTFVRALRSVRPADYGWQTAALRAPVSRLPAVSAAMRDGTGDAIALHSGYPDPELLPGRLVRSALTRAIRSESALSRPPVDGLPALRNWFAHELAESTPSGIAAPTGGDVVVVPGSQSGLSSLFRALVGRGRPVVLESPTYWGAILAAAQTGVHVVPVASGPDGPDPDELSRVFRDSGARVFYAQPNYANPTGAQWPRQAAQAVLEVVHRHGAFVIEDDWAHDFGISSEPVPLAASDDTGHVIYLRSLTKSVSPAVRVAAVIARGPARERILADRVADSMYVSEVLQRAALDVVTNPAWLVHLRGVRRQLQTRRDLLLTSLRDHAPQAYVEHVPAGGLNLWARLPVGVDVDQLATRCEQAGLLIAPGTEWFPAEPAAPFVRLNYSGPDPAAFPRGASILAAQLSPDA